MKKSRVFLWLIVILLAATGLVLYWLMPSDPDDFPHPFSNLFRQLHGWSAGFFLVILGFMINDHMQKKWRRHLRHVEGSIHASLWSLLFISGWLIYYPPEWMNFEWIKWTHIITGFIICVFFPVHVLRKVKS